MNTNPHELLDSMTAEERAAATALLQALILYPAEGTVAGDAYEKLCVADDRLSEVLVEINPVREIKYPSRLVDLLAQTVWMIANAVQDLGVEPDGPDLPVSVRSSHPTYMPQTRNFREVIAPMDNKILVRFILDCGRMGNLNGLFICEAADLEGLYGKRVYFGEVLGKHSEIEEVMKPSHFKIISEDQDKITWLEQLCGRTVSGHNPFSYIDEEEEDEDEGEE